MRVRAFAVITGPDGITAVEQAREYEDFGWNMTKAQVENFINDRDSESIYGIVVRSGS